MDKEKMRSIIRKKSKYRKALFSIDFYEFVYYNFNESFAYPFADYHTQYAKFMGDGDNVLFIGHRESAKTQWAMWYLIRCICNKKKNYIIRANFDKAKSEMMLYKVREILQLNDKILYDYGNLYDDTLEPTTKRKTKTKKTLKEFITTNGIFVQAQSLGTSTRGLNHLNDNILYRPDLYIGDDLDTTDSVKNPKVINDNYIKVKGEALGGLSSTSQVILIGNIIREDGLVPRFERDFKKAYQYLRIPTYIHDNGVAWINDKEYGRVGEFSWDRFVKTKHEAKEKNKKHKDAPRPPFVSVEYLKERDGEIAYGQNHLLIPYIDGTTIIRKSMIRFVDDYPTRHAKIVMGIDPAFSEKTHADSMAITISVFQESKRYVIYNEAFDGKDKDLKKFCIFIKNLYKEYNVNQITIEGNNGGEIIGKELKDKSMVCNIKYTKKDKVQRLIELQPAIENGEILFLKSFGYDHPMMQEMFIFPNGDHDDRVDSMIISLENPPKMYKANMIDTSTQSSFSKFSI